MKTRLLFVLPALLIMLWGSTLAQPQQTAEVVSSGGGKTQGGTYTNFGVVGEPVANQLPAGANFNDKQGFINKMGPSSCPITLFPEHYDLNSALHENYLSALITIGGAEASECVWFAETDVPWIVFTSAASGIGSGTLTFNVLRNETGIVRNGTITVTTGDSNPEHSPKFLTITQYNTLSVPTLPEWAMIVFGTLLLAGSGYYLRRSGLI